MIKSLKIGGHDYKIRRLKLGTEWGYVEPEHTRITLCNTGVTKRRQMITLLHESIHAVLHEYGISQYYTESSEEQTTKSLETGIVRLIMDNPQFSRDLIKSLLETKRK